MRFITANLHPDHDTIATFRRKNGQAVCSAFEQVLLLASEAGLFKVGTVWVDGTKVKANASKIKSVRYDRIQVLGEKLAQDIAALMEQAEAADNADEEDGLSLPQEIARRESLKTKLNAAAKRLEKDSASGHDDNDDDDNDGDTPPPSPKPDRQTNLTDPDSAIMRKPARHEYTQAYNAQAIGKNDGSQLVLGTNVYATPNDQHGLEALVDHVCNTVGTPDTLLADSGYAGKTVIEALEARAIEPRIAVTRQQEARASRPMRTGRTGAKSPKAITAPWRAAMLKKLKTDDAKTKIHR